MKKLTLLIIYILTGSIGVAGFNIRNHKKISKASMRQYKEVTGVGIKCCYIRAFARGSASEDSPFKMLRKYKNQHFYKENIKLDSNRTFTHRLEELYKELNAKKNKRGRSYWRTAGKIAHYYQDLACPPHVIPIYHLGSDGFDGVKLSAPLASAGIAVSALDQMSNLPGKQLLDTLAASTYLATRTGLTYKQNGEVQTGSWEIFWTRDHNQTGAKHFGSYGKAGNNYGRIEFKCEHITSKKLFFFTKDSKFTCPNCTDTFQVDEKEYDVFKTKRVQQAVYASAVIIHFAMNLK